MKVLIACEESQAICIAFRNTGHEAYSCDIQEPSGGHPEWHILGDAILPLRGGADRNNGRHNAQYRNLGFAHCTPALHLPQQCGGKAPLERSSAPRGPRYKRHSRQGSIYAVLVGRHPKNLRRKSNSKSGFCASAIYTEYPTVSIWTSVHEENVLVVERTFSATSYEYRGADCDVVPIWLVQSRPW